MLKFVLVTTLALAASTFAYVEDRDPVTGDTRCKYRAVGRSENPRGHCASKSILRGHSGTPKIFKTP